MEYSKQLKEKPFQFRSSAKKTRQCLETDTLVFELTGLMRQLPLGHKSIFIDDSLPLINQTRLF